MSLLWKAALLVLALLAFAIVPSYVSIKRIQQPEQFTQGYDWRQPEEQR